MPDLEYAYGFNNDKSRRLMGALQVLATFQRTEGMTDSQAFQALFNAVDRVARLAAPSYNRDGAAQQNVKLLVGDEVNPGWKIFYLQKTGDSTDSPHRWDVYHFVSKYSWINTSTSPNTFNENTEILHLSSNVNNSYSKYARTTITPGAQSTSPATTSISIYNDAGIMPADIYKICV